VIETEGAAAEADAAPAPKAEEVEERIEVETSDASDADDAVAAETPSPLQGKGRSALSMSKGAEGVGDASDGPHSPALSPEGEREKKVLASPAVRARARDLGIDLTEVKPAEDGRVRHADLDSFLAYNAGSGFSAAGRARADEEIKVIGLRKRIAQNMAESKRNIPHFSYVEECDVTELERLRADLNASRGDKPKLTMLPLLIAAICRTLPDFPMINARYDDEAGVVTRHGAAP